MMTLLGLLIGWILGWIILKTGAYVLDRVQERKAIGAAMKPLPGFPELDEEGSAKTYDAHYTRDLEIAGGVKVETKCDDTSCKKCYWKARMLTTAEPKLFGVVKFLRQRDEFIESLPDDYSDDLYDMFYQDWLKEKKPELDVQRKIWAQTEEEKWRRKEEEYYATPYEQIKKYKAEGRTYKPGAGWSHPKALTPRKRMAKSDMEKIAADDWTKEAHRLIAEIKAMNEIPGNINPNPVVDMQIDYEWDLKSGMYYRTLVSIHKNGGKSFKRETVSKREYNDWRN